ncbi:hypothetical protein L195_g064081, partial [Trifolium pratense]
LRSANWWRTARHSSPRAGVPPVWFAIARQAFAQRTARYCSSLLAMSQCLPNVARYSSLSEQY